MQSDNITYLIYDKFAGDHAYDNAITKSITVAELFSSDYQYYEGEDAIKTFNEYGGIYHIPLDLNEEVFTVYLFTVKVKSKMNAVITVIGVNNIHLEMSVREDHILNKQFLIDACSYHLRYEHYTNLTQSTTPAKGMVDQTRQQIDTNTTDIIAVATQPNGDVTDAMIADPYCTRDDYKMFNYQKRTVNWLLDKERNKRNINFNLNEEIQFGNVIYDSISKTFIPIEKRKIITFNGGALIDEVGLGKTYQMLVLSMLNPATDVSYITTLTSKLNKLNSRATLIICPNQLCGQWVREVTKMIKDDCKTVTIPMLTKNHFDKYTYIDLLDADFVVMSYNFLGNQCYLSKWMTKLSRSKSYHKTETFDHQMAEKTFDEMGKELINNPAKLYEKGAIPNLIHWHRIIVDEFHEIYTVSKYDYMKNIIKLFKSNYAWCVSGTPFDKGSSCLVKMLDFTTGFSNNKGEHVLLSKNIKEHMIKNFFRRNTKKSVTDEYKLLPLKEHIIWLKFSQTERMMYNAYLVNPNVDKFSVLMRQICCHPKLAEEIKNTLSNCKTLEDIEKTMIKHYEKAMIDADRRVRFIKYRIRKTYRKIKIISFKQQRRMLRQEGYKVIIILPEKTQEEIDEETVFSNVNATEFDDLGAPVDNDEEINNDTNSEDEGKPEFIVSDDTQKKVMAKIGKQLDEHPLQVIADLHETRNNWNAKLILAQKEYDGKRVTYEFFTNMKDRVKKTLAKEEKKAEESDSDSNSDSDSSSDVSEDDEEVCGICMCEIDGNDVGVTKCGHIYCFQCLKVMIEKTHKCPMCSKAVATTEIYMISYEKQQEKEQTKDIIDKNSLINQVGTKLANLIYYIKSIPDKCIIFSQWDDLLRKVGDILDTYGVPNVFCRGNVWQRDKAIREFSSKPDVKVIMLSSESAASGTNLTSATTVILLDPVYGSYEYRMNTEWQAIGRAYRMGQQKQVTVVRFIIKNTVEEEIYDLNKLEDSKHNHKVNLFETTDDKLILTEDKLNEITKSVEVSKLKKKVKSETKASLKQKEVLVKSTTKKVVAHIDNENFENDDEDEENYSDDGY